MTVDTIPDWASFTSTPSRVYLDSLGRVRYTKAPGGTYQQTSYDQLGRVTSAIRYPGTPPTATPTVMSSWAYDKRGRVKIEFADASGVRLYSYLPTGELVQVLQSPSSTGTTTDANAVWSLQMIGSLGRLVERDDYRWITSGTCAASAQR